MTEWKRIVLFDGVCNLCNNSIQFVIKRDHKSLLKYASLQSELGKSLLSKYQLNPNELDSVVLIEKGRAYKNSSAALRISKHLGFPTNTLQLFLLIPYQLRDLVYKWIARNRYQWFGKSETCMLPSEEIMNRFLEYEELS